MEMRMKLAASTMGFLWEGKGFDDVLAAIRSKPNIGWEIADDGPHRLNRRSVQHLDELRSSYGVEFTVHCPIDGLTISSPYAQVRRVSMDVLRSSLRMARKISAHLWVLHPGVRSLIPPARADVQRNNLASVKTLLEIAENLDVPVGIENMVPGTIGLLSNVADYKTFRDELGDIFKGMVLDVGHAHIGGEVFKFIEAMAGEIKHVHVHDNDGSRDSHQAIGRGTIDWKRLISELRCVGFNGALCFEGSSVADTWQSLSTLESLLS